jgi:hypothetical protein
MTSLNQKIKLALDESRMLILGAQILLGFQFRAVFESGFSNLAESSQLIELIVLAILLLTIGLIMWPGSYHRIVWHGSDTSDIHEFTTRVMFVALLPFSFALSLEFYVISRQMLGLTGAVTVGIAMGSTALLLWYALGGVSRLLEWETNPNTKRKEPHIHMKNELYDKVEQVLIETRVVLPGVQALLGFQLATILSEGFDKLTSSSKYVHFTSLLLMGLTVILLMTPAAYHRIVEHGEATEHFHHVASVFLLAAMVSLPLGMCGDLFVVMRQVTNSLSVATISSLIALTFFYSLWFGSTLYRKHTVTR